MFFLVLKTLVAEPKARRAGVDWSQKLIEFEWFDSKDQLASSLGHVGCSDEGIIFCDEG